MIPGGLEPGREAPRGVIVVGAREVVTLAGGVRTGRAQGEVVRLRGDGLSGEAPAVAIVDGVVAGVAPRGELERSLVTGGHRLDSFEVIDAGGGTVTPGLVDPHTHLLFAGSREGELELRQRGAAYLEILAAGGGILSTVAATRAASEDDLLAHGRRWLGEMLRHGVTTVEAKSGYGLDVDTELRLLSVADQLGREGPVEVVPTWLGAHAVPPELRGDGDATERYVDALIADQLPAVADQGVAVAADVFCEHGVFSAEQSRRVLAAAAHAGLRPRLHADELAPSGGAELAAEIGATSADHLASPSPAGIDALAAAAANGRPVVATLLPATTWFLMKDHHAPARTFIDRGVPVAIGTDFNPGTSPTPSVPLAMTAACLNLRMTPDEVLTAVTINAAQALGLADRIGSLEPGKQGDLVVWNVPTSRQIPYWPAADLVQTVVKRGRVVVGGGTEG